MKTLPGTFDLPAALSSFVQMVKIGKTVEEAIKELKISRMTYFNIVNKKYPDIKVSTLINFAAYDGMQLHDFIAKLYFLQK